MPVLQIRFGRGRGEQAWHERQALFEIDTGKAARASQNAFLDLLKGQPGHDVGFEDGVANLSVKRIRG